MHSHSTVILLGNLVRDPELKYTKTGKPIVTMTIVVNHHVPRNDDDEPRVETSFIDSIGHGKIAENCSTYLERGSLILIEGRLSQRRWEDEEGNRHSKIVVVVSQVKFLSYKKSPEENHGREPGDENIPF